MEFGFNLFFIFFLFLFPLIGILIVSGILTKKMVFSRLFLFIIIGILGLFSVSTVSRWLMAKTILDKDDYYGEYVINRAYFAGAQADWQYNNFRFEIKDNDSIYFYVTDKEKVQKTYRGLIRTKQPYGSARLVLNMDGENHHILVHNPTTYRSSWNFYLVFYSPQFNNVYFKKGKWKPIDD